MTALPGFVFAQSEDTGTGSVSTGSGTTASGDTVQEEEAPDFSLEAIQRRAAEALWEAREQRSQDFRSQLLQTSKLMDGIRLQRKNFIQKRSEHRTECRRNIRRASKLTKLKTNVVCYREELSLQLELLEKERAFVEQVPGVTDDVRWLTLTRIDLLTDALAVVITAMDSDVYETIEELEEVKQNLLLNYRVPYWLMMTRLRADRMLTWTASIMTRIGKVAEQEEVSEEMGLMILDALNCLTEEETMLKSVTNSNDILSARTELRQSYAKMRTCIGIVHDINAVRSGLHTEEEEEEVVEETPSCENDPTISRRLRKRLGSNCEVYGED